MQNTNNTNSSVPDCKSIIQHAELKAQERKEARYFVPAGLDSFIPTPAKQALNTFHDNVNPHPKTPHIDPSSDGLTSYTDNTTHARMHGDYKCDPTWGKIPASNISEGPTNPARTGPCLPTQLPVELLLLILDYLEEHQLMSLACSKKPGMAWIGDLAGKCMTHRIQSGQPITISGITARWYHRFFTNKDGSLRLEHARLSDQSYGAVSASGSTASRTYIASLKNLRFHSIPEKEDVNKLTEIFTMSQKEGGKLENVEFGTGVFRPGLDFWKSSSDQGEDVDLPDGHSLYQAVAWGATVHLNIPDIPLTFLEESSVPFSYIQQHTLGVIELTCEESDVERFLSNEVHPSYEALHIHLVYPNEPINPSEDEEYFSRPFARAMSSRWPKPVVISNLFGMSATPKRVDDFKKTARLIYKNRMDQLGYPERQADDHEAVFDSLVTVTDIHRPVSKLSQVDKLDARAYRELLGN